MSSAIWKFELRVIGEQTVRMPFGATVLSAQIQRDRICLWATVDTDMHLQPRRFAIFGTGHDLPKPIAATFNFIDTIQANGLVFHVFELDPP